jgi:hypothetical protein
MKTRLAALAALVAVILAASSVNSGCAWVDEHFDTNSTNLATDYPAYSLAGPGSADVSGTQLHIYGNSTTPTVLMTTTAFAAVPLTISVQLTSITGSVGGHNVGVYLGNSTPVENPSIDNNIVFHPGASGGLLRVEGLGGFGNQNVGFTPAQGVLHTLEITSDGLGHFTLTFTDGGNSANTYSNGWTNTSNTSFKVGLYTCSDSPTAAFDNWTVVPEPSAGMLMLGSGMAWLLGRRRT